MTGQREWLERQAEAWDARADALVDGDSGARVRAQCLRLVTASLRTRLAALALADPCPPHPVVDAITWQSPIFWPDARFDPFAGTKAMRMLASAATCRAKGYHDAATGFERRAVEMAAEPPPSPPAPRWGANANFTLPVPDPAPFRAGPQMDMFG